MKSIFRLCQYILRILLFVVVLLAITIGVSRSLFPQVDRYHNRFEAWASQALHQPVSIGKIQANWSGLHPTLIFHEVTVYDATKSRHLLEVERLQVGINLFSSLIHRDLRPSLVHITGARLTIQRLNPQQFLVNQIPITTGTGQNHLGDMNGLFQWIADQGQVMMDRIDLDWIQPNGTVIPMTNLQIKLTHHLLKSQLIGLGTLVNTQPAHIRFVLNIQGNLWQSQKKAVEGYLYVNQLDMSPWLQNQIFESVKGTSGRLDHAQFWFQWADQGLKQLQGVFNLSDLNLNFLQKNTLDSQENPVNKEKSTSSHTPTMQNLKNPGTSSLEIDHLAANVIWRKKNEGWDFAANKIQLQVDKKTLPMTHFSLQTAPLEKNRWVQIMRADILNLEQLSDWIQKKLWLPNTQKELLAGLQPKGDITHIMVRREFENPTLPNENNFFDINQLSASFALKQLEISAFRQIPGLKNFNAQVKISPQAGELWMDNKNLTVNDPGHFDHSLQLDHYKAKVFWYKSNNQEVAESGLKLAIYDLLIEDEALKIHGDMALTIPDSGESPFIDLLLDIQQNQVNQFRHYVPTHAMSPGLGNWLSHAFVGGNRIQGQVLFHGQLSHFPFDDHTGRFEVIAQTQGVELHYAEGWPVLNNLDAQVMIEGRKLKIDVSKVNLLGLPADTVSAEIPNLAQADLKVNASIRANSADGIRFITNSPLKKTLGKTFSDLQLNGPMQLQLGLQIPLYQGGGETKVEGRAFLEPYHTLMIPDLKIVVEKLHGNLHFTENSLDSKELTGEWLKQPVQATITTTPVKKNGHSINIAWQNPLAISDIEQHYGMDLNSLVTGNTHLAGLLQLISHQGTQKMLLTLNSDLNGIALNLPDLLHKNANEKASSQIQIQFGGNQNQWLYLQGNYGKKANIALTLQKLANQWDFKGGEIRLGAAPAILRNTTGWVITGQLPTLNASEIQDFITPYLEAEKKNKKSSSPSSNWTKINQIDLRIAQLNALGLQINQANIQAQPIETSASREWELKINSPLIAGQINLPNNLQTQPIRGIFDRFTLLTGASKTVNRINPGKIPPLDLIFNRFYYKDKFWGKVEIKTFPHTNAMQISRLALTLDDFEWSSQGEWEQTSKGRDHTTLSGQFKTGNLGAALKSLEITGSLVSGSGNGAFAISWSSAAYDFSLGKLNGYFNFNFRNGRIINIGQSAQAEVGLGRILNLLSLQSLPRRLTLDFSDLTSKGFVFDVMKGDFNLNQGDAVTSNATLRGPVAKVDVKGHIDLNDENYNLTMFITPYVTSSIPVVAGIAAGPIAGAAAFVATKVLGGVVNKITTQTYQVTGSWDEPVIEKSK